jgi:PleD family two-component response regulator
VSARVLLCDSLPDHSLMLSMELGAHEDVEVVGAAHDGRRALEAVERASPDVVVADLELPVVGGVDLVRRILELEPRARVVVLSGPESEDLVPDALRLGAVAHVGRRQPAHRVVESIRAAMDRPSPSPSPTEGDDAEVAVVGDEGLVALVASALADSGGRARGIADADALLQHAQTYPPHLVVLDATRAPGDALEVSRRLRSDAATRGVPIVVVVDAALDPTTLSHVTAASNDYVVAPPRADELRMRMEAAMRRSYELGGMNPLTYLPGNALIERELRRRAESGEPFALLHVDLDNFKAYNDRYGFLRGDEVIKLEANTTVAVVRKHAQEGFVGHVGGDDMIVIVEPDRAEPIARDVVAEWDRLVLGLYEPADVARGYLEVPDRLGEVRRYPLSTISIGIATSVNRPALTHWEASESAAEMKRFAKAQDGSSYAFDRRAGEERRRVTGEPPPHGDRRRRIIRLDG